MYRTHSSQDPRLSAVATAEPDPRRVLPAPLLSKPCPGLRLSSRAVDNVAYLGHAIPQLLVSGVARYREVIRDATNRCDETLALPFGQLVQHAQCELATGGGRGEVADVAHLGQAGQRLQRCRLKSASCQVRW